MGRPNDDVASGARSSRVPAVVRARGLDGNGRCRVTVPVATEFVGFIVAGFFTGFMVSLGGVFLRAVSGFFRDALK